MATNTKIKHISKYTLDKMLQKIVVGHPVSVGNIHGIALDIQVNSIIDGKEADIQYQIRIQDKISERTIKTNDFYLLLEL